MRPHLEMAARRRRRAYVLVLVLVVTTLVGAGLTVLTFWAAEGFAERRADQTRRVAHAIADSGAAYARAHAQQWAANPPQQDVTLEVGELLLPNMTGSAVISFPEVDGRRRCHVTATAEMGAAVIVDEIDVEVAAAATQPTGTAPAREGLWFTGSQISHGASVIRGGQQGKHG
jgi:hypothetical protein